MINVTIKTATARRTVIVPTDMTIADFIAENDVPTSGQNNLNGRVLTAADMNKTFADFGITEDCYMSNVSKHDNAVC